MPLETASYISELDATWPLGTDPVSQGDDHVRLVKGVLQTQFPNLGAAPVTATAEDLSGSPTPVGTVLPYAGSDEPEGYFLCNGGVHSRTTQAALYAVIGITYGAGDGSTTFNVPDLRGKVPAMLGDGNLIATDAGKDVWTEDDLPAHGHTTSTNGAHTHPILRTTAGGSVGTFTLDNQSNNNGSYNTGTPPMTASEGAHVHTVNNTGSGGDNRQATLYINYIIKT